MKKNDLIIYEFRQLELTDLTEKQQEQLAKELIENVNIKNLEDTIHKCILKLSGIGGPSFMADARYIALDNQKKLELIYMLLYNLDIFKADIKYMKKHIDDYYMDNERIYSFLHYTKELIDTIYDYGEYRKEDLKTQLKQLATHEIVLSAYQDMTIPLVTIDKPKSNILDDVTNEKKKSKTRK